MNISYNKNKLKEPFRFILVGIIATAIQYIVYLLLLNIIYPTTALTVGYIVSMVCNFLLTTYYTFSTKPTRKKASGFILSHATNYLLQLIMLNLFIYIGISIKWAPLPMYMVCVPINFIMIKFFFKRPKM